MSYHGFGQTFPQPITSGIATVSQPTSPVLQMVPMNTNPMIPPGEYASGEQAMMIEMQSRTSAPQTATYVSTPPSGPAPAAAPPNIAKYSDEQLYKMLVEFWTAIRAGKESPYVNGFMEAVMNAGKGYIVGQAEQYVMSGGKSGGFMPAGVAPTLQPAQSIVSQGAPVAAPMPSGSITGQFAPASAITTYVPSTSLNPQPSTTATPVSAPPKVVSKEVLYAELIKYWTVVLSGQQPHHDLVEAVTYANNTGQSGLSDQARNFVMSSLNPAQPSTTIQAPPPPPPTTTTTTTGTIPPGPDATATIPQGQLPPTTPQYVVSPAAAVLPPPVATSTSSNLLPLIAIGVGAFILAKML